MRRVAALAVTLSFALPVMTAAQAPAGPPHASLFGAWVGGAFPPPVTLGAQECLAAPMVIFTRDAVLRALPTSPAYAQRLIETARATGNGFELHLVPQSGDPGFNCPDPNVLPVQRRGENEISFPGCTAFPFPLIRCATH